MTRYLVRILNASGYKNTDCKKLKTIASRICQNTTASVGNLRVTSKAIEFDLLLNGDTDELLEELTSSLSQSLGTILNAKLLDTRSVERPKDHILKEARFYFNEERFWECHEALEEVWRNEHGTEKELLQAIILFAAAFVHFQKNRIKTALSILKRARPKLHWPNQFYYDIDIHHLAAEVESIIMAENVSLFRI